MSKKTEQTEIAQTTTQAYKVPYSAHLFDKDFQYILNAHGERDASGELLEIQDPLRGVAYHSLEAEDKVEQDEYQTDTNEQETEKAEKQWTGIEAIVNVVNRPGIIYGFDMPGRSNSLINAIKKDINRTIRMWSRNVKDIFIICPLLNPTKSVEAAEAQALEFHKIKPGNGQAKVHFVFVFFPQNKHFASVMTEFKKSRAIQDLAHVGEVHTVMINPEFNAELPEMIDNENKSWKLKDLVNENISNFAWDILCEFIDSTTAAWQKRFGHLRNIGPNDKGALIIFMSAEGGVRKSTLAGSLIEWFRS